MNIIVHKTKKFFALFALVSTISLTSCNDNTKDLLPEPITNIETLDEDINDRIEIVEEQEEINEIKEYYNIDQTYINITPSYDVVISDNYNESMVYSYSLREIMDKYHYEYTSDIVTNKYLTKLTESVQRDLDSLMKKYPFGKKINLNDIVFYSSYDLKDGKLYNRLFMYEENYTELYDKIIDPEEKVKHLQNIIVYRQNKDNFKKEYSDFIIKDEEDEYLSIVDFAFLNTNNTICYIANLEDIFNNLPSATDKEIDSYKKGILKNYGINIDSTKELFNPNDIENIENIFSTYIDNCLQLPDSFYSTIYDDKIIKDIDYRRIIIKYVALNENIKDETIEYLINKYIPTYNYMKASEFRSYSLNNYYVEIGDESLASVQGINNSLAFYTNLYRNNYLDTNEILSTLSQQKLSYKNPEKLCKELYIMQSVYQQLSTNTIKDIISNVYIKHYIDICPLSQIENIEMPVVDFKPSSDDINAIALILSDEYMTDNTNNLFRNFEKAANRKNNYTK